VGPCNPPVEMNNNTSNETKYWSVPENWPNGTVPVEGEDVEIPWGTNWIFDMNPSPIYKMIQVNGNLSFSNETDTHLRVKHLFIRAGEVHIGSEE